MKQHIAKVTSTCFYQLWRLRKVRRLVRQELTAPLVHAFVLSWLDYGNSVTAGLLKSAITPLHRVQHAASGLVIYLKMHDHVTHALRQLNWLLVHLRVKFKLCTMMYSIHTGWCRLYESKSRQYWITKTLDAGGDSRKLWQSVSLLMGDSKGSKSIECSHTADNFAKFFQDKIELIRSETVAASPPDMPETEMNLLDCWLPVTVENIEKLINAAPIKSCQLDPVPTWLIKKQSSLLAPFIAALIIVLLASGHFPNCLKHAIVVQLLKKNNLDAASLKTTDQCLIWHSCQNCWRRLFNCSCSVI
jgi:hypothetical protein